MNTTNESITEDLIHRLLTRAAIRRQISTRKSVQEGKPDRIADLLEEAARELRRLGLRDDHPQQKLNEANITRKI